MTNSELEAVERYRLWKAGKFDYAAIDSHPLSMLNDDRETLADMLLAANPADDEEPIDPNWLETFGMPRDHPPASKKSWFFDFLIHSQEEDTTWLRIHSPNGDGEHMTEVYNKDFTPGGTTEGVGLLSSWVKTKGEFRRLASALGIALKS